MNQIYDILAEFQNQGKHITLYLVLANVGFKYNEAADNAAKDAIYMLETRSTGLFYTEYYPAVLVTPNGNWSRKTELAN